MIQFIELLLFSIFFTNAHAITACPANAKTFTTDDGSVYEHCPYTDYQTNSAQVIPNIYTVHDCVQICNKQGAACTQAVWDGHYKYCHVKASGGNWAVSRQFDTIHLVKKGEQPVRGLSSCPTTPSFYEHTSGAVFEICPNSDYHGTSLVVNWQIQDQISCAQFCANKNDCVLGIWDKQYKACHIKANATELTWVNVSTQFDAIRLIAPPAPQPVPTGLTSCPSGAVQWKLDDGSLYEVCPNTDFQTDSYNVIPNVLSSWDCVHLCNQDTACTLSVFDHQYFYCHFKNLDNIKWGTSSQFDTGRLIQRGSRSASAYTGRGRWAAPITVPANPVGAFVVPRTSRVLGFSAWGDDDYYGPSGITQFSDWNFQTLQISQRTVTNTGHDMFCPGISTLSDGRVIITGGSDADKTSLYDPASDTFSSGGGLKIARGYQASVTIDSGEVFTIGGSYSGGVGGKTGEIYDPATNTWAVLSGCDPNPALTAGTTANSDDHMWLYGWKQGSVFQAGPSKAQHWYSTSGSGNTTLSGTRDANNDAMCGLHAMYDAVQGKIWSAGGSNDYTNSPGLTTAHITTIGQPFQPATVQQVSSLPRARAFANVVILPDGTLLVTGGQTTALVFTDTDSQFIADLYNPATDTWTSLEPAKIPRNYHSNSLLLADGTVYTGGGGLCWTGEGMSDAACSRAAEHPSVEIFFPPYLFNADGTYATRPNIQSVSSTSDGSGNTAKPSDTLTVIMGDSSVSTTFSLVRLGTATHTVNTDQRRVPLAGQQSGSTWALTLPNDHGILIPGFYYLFAMNGNGVPSYASTVQIL